MLASGAEVRRERSCTTRIRICGRFFAPPPLGSEIVSPTARFLLGHPKWPAGVADGEFVARVKIDATIARKEQPQPAPTILAPMPPTKPELKQDRQYFVDGLQDIRKLLQRMGTALGAAATALLAGLGYARLHDLFPLPHGKVWVPIVAGVLGALAVFGSAWLAARFFGAQRRILILPSQKENALNSDISPDERGVIETTYERYVARYTDGSDVCSGDLQAVEHRVQKLRDGGEEELAARLAAVAVIAQFDAVTRVLEHRSNQAFKGRLTYVALAMAVVGIFGLFAIADYSKSKRPGSNSAVEKANLDRTKADTASIKANTALLCLRLRRAGVKPPRDACGP